MARAPFYGSRLPENQGYWRPSDLALASVAMPLAPGVTSAACDVEGFSGLTLYFLTTQAATLTLNVFDEIDLTIVQAIVLVAATPAGVPGNFNFAQSGQAGIVLRKVSFNFTANAVAGSVTARLFARPHLF